MHRKGCQYCPSLFPTLLSPAPKEVKLLPPRPLHRSHPQHEWCYFPRALSGHRHPRPPTAPPSSHPPWLPDTYVPDPGSHLPASLHGAPPCAHVPRGSLRPASHPHPPLSRVTPCPATTDGLPPALLRPRPARLAPEEVRPSTSKRQGHRPPPPAPLHLPCPREHHMLGSRASSWSPFSHLLSPVNPQGPTTRPPPLPSDHPLLSTSTAAARARAPACLTQFTAGASCCSFRI